MPLQLAPNPATDRLPSLLGQRTAQPPHRLPNRASGRGSLDGSPGPAHPRPEPPPGGSGNLNFWLTLSVIVFSCGAIAVSYCDKEQSLAAGVIITITGLALMATALWEGIVLADRERQDRRGDR